MVLGSPQSSGGFLGGQKLVKVGQVASPSTEEVVQLLERVRASKNQRKRLGSTDSD